MSEAEKWYETGKSWNLDTAPNFFYIPRQEPHARVIEALANDHFAVVTGQSGMGKSELVRQLAIQQQAEQKYDTVIALDCSDNLLRQYTEVIEGRRLDIFAGYKLARDLEHIEAGPHGLSTLLIFDNASTRKPSRLVRPSSKRDIIVIGEDLPNPTIRLIGMSPDEGAELVLKSSKKIEAWAHPDEAGPSLVAEAKTISEGFGGSPLWLMRAGFYIEYTGCSLGDFTHLFNDRENHDWFLKRLAELH